jgi:RNA polymerase sigma factor (sigma-70 family)
VSPATRPVPTEVAGKGEEEGLLGVLLARRNDFLRFLERRLGDRATAEDVLQEALFRAAGRLSELRKGQAVVGWFYRVLENAIISHHRRGSISGRALERLASEAQLAVPVGEGLASGTCRCVGHLMTGLKPDYAQALRRIEVDGLAVKHFAREAGITSGNAAVRAFRARTALRQQVMEACGACAADRCTDCTCEA